MARVSFAAPPGAARSWAWPDTVAETRPEPPSDIDQALQIAAALCRRFEGLRLRPYLCPAGVPTIGYGATRYASGRRVTLRDPPITVELAEAFLARSLRRDYLPHVLAICRAGTSPRRLAALTSFTFNLGPGNLRASTLRLRVMAERWEDVPTELRKWRYAGGREMPGLVARRAAEATLV